MDYTEKAKEFVQLMSLAKGSPKQEMMRKISGGECFNLLRIMRKTADIVGRQQ